MPLRAYPSGLADSIHKLYMEELRSEPHGDLRFDTSPPAEKSELQLFTELAVGDHWGDANLLPVFEYVYKCKHVRTAPSVNMIYQVVFCEPLQSTHAAR